MRVAAIYSVGLHDMSRHMQPFMAMHPNARVLLECLHPHKVVEAVLGDQVDLGILSYPPANRALEVLPLREEPMVLVCHPSHRLARRRVAEAGDLQGERFVAFDHDLPIRRAIDRVLRQAGVRVEVVMQFDNIETIKQAIAHRRRREHPAATCGGEGGRDPDARRRAAGDRRPGPAGRASSTGRASACRRPSTASSTCSGAPGTPRRRAPPGASPAGESGPDAPSSPPPRRATPAGSRAGRSRPPAGRPITLRCLGPLGTMCAVCSRAGDATSPGPRRPSRWPVQQGD